MSTLYLRFLSLSLVCSFECVCNPISQLEGKESSCCRRGNEREHTSGFVCTRVKFQSVETVTAFSNALRIKLIANNINDIFHKPPFVSSTGIWETLIIQHVASRTGKSIDLSYFEGAIDCEIIES
mmetsp:Transcript_18522/g.28141  ORF Transcript_18522/g.28141 Transcript_18522/m.28141 type:complete len:125 (+) Transcript_18522:1023-1397(+)